MVELSELMADEIINSCIPLEEELSENIARKLYGDKWLRRHLAIGDVKYTRKGPMKAFLRKDLDALRRKDREPATLIFRTPKSK